MNKKYRCIVVDDDDIDRLTTQSFLKDYPAIEVVATFDDPLKALAFAQHEPLDILFLDIDMPQMSGLDVRKQLMNIPACVFITSFPDYAVESFEMAAIDFIVKPHQRERFATTMNRVLAYVELQTKANLLSHQLGGDTIFIKDGHHQVKINLHDVLYIEALKDYSSIVTTNRKYCVLQALGNLLKEPNFSKFMRIHRSYAVQKGYIKKITAKELVLLNDVVLPIGRVFKDAVDQLL
ncbi:LytR/AlgR family response regulator transcription factor [Ferruginibacter yonginensis]|uniref:LytR/AlgR family response regulator transcription factor n=1 Tax=Ferruginibacter yonginensis TaxID=1310416 RepID=A0ABV8QNN4_9BACT